MITIITGASHTGKTLLATEIVRRTGALALSIDLLKMGFIRSGQTSLTPYDDDELTDFLWPLVSEMARTAIENQQNRANPNGKTEHPRSTDQRSTGMSFTCLRNTGSE